MTARSAKTSTTAFKIPDSQHAYPVGHPMFTFFKGTDAYEEYEVGNVIDVVQANGRKHTGVVSTVLVGPLIDLLASYGAQTFSSYGKPYTAKGVVQALAKEAGETVLDVTKLYTAVSVMLNAPTNEVEQA